MLRRVSLIVLLFIAPFAVAAKKNSYATPQMPTYRVESRGFNNSPRDIKKLCDSAGRELWKNFDDYKIEKFVIVRGRGGPITLFKRNSKGEIVIRLDTGNALWSQYSYQFAHELCHVVEDRPAFQALERLPRLTAKLRRRCDQEANQSARDLRKGPGRFLQD